MPIVSVRCKRRFRASRFVRYPSSFTDASTRSRISGSTLVLPLRIREAVALDTPAWCATSRSCTLLFNAHDPSPAEPASQSGNRFLDPEPRDATVVCQSLRVAPWFPTCGRVRRGHIHLRFSSQTEETYTAVRVKDMLRTVTTQPLTRRFDAHTIGLARNRFHGFDLHVILAGVRCTARTSVPTGRYRCQANRYLSHSRPVDDHVFAPRRLSHGVLAT